MPTSIKPEPTVPERLQAGVANFELARQFAFDASKVLETDLIPDDTRHRAASIVLDIDAMLAELALLNSGLIQAGRES